MNIPHNIFLVWLGDVVPDYAKYATDAYIKINPEFKVNLINHSGSYILDARQSLDKEKFDSLIVDSIIDIKDPNKSPYKKLIIA